MMRIYKEWRTLHTGQGFKMGCGYNFQAHYICLNFGKHHYEQIIKLDYSLDIDQVKAHTEALT